MDDAKRESLQRLISRLQVIAASVLNSRNLHEAILPTIDFESVLREISQLPVEERPWLTTIVQQFRDAYLRITQTDDRALSGDFYTIDSVSRLLKAQMDRVSRASTQPYEPDVSLAQQKLAKIMHEPIAAMRFMNIGEFNSSMREGKFYHECNESTPQDEIHLKKLFEWGAQMGWNALASQYTHWPQSSSAPRNYDEWERELIKLLKQHGKPEGYRLFQEYIIPHVEYAFHHERYPIEFPTAKEAKERLQAMTTNYLKLPIGRFPQPLYNTYHIIASLIHDPNYIVSQEKNIREILLALTPGSRSRHGAEHVEKPYHILVLFEQNRNPRRLDWRAGAWTDLSAKNEDICGVICIVQNRALYQQVHQTMRESAATDPKVSFPIFQPSGFLLFPKG